MLEYLISIIIPAFNSSKTIERAIRSVINQQMSFGASLEVIIIDDASEDNTLEIIKKYQENPRFKILKNKTKKGVSYSCNKALKSSNGHYIFRLDSDDFISPNLLQVCLDILINNKDFDYVFSDLQRVDALGNKTEVFDRGKWDNLLESGAGVFLRKSILKKINWYDESLKNCEDMDFMLRLHQSQHKGFHIPIPAYRYYDVPGSLSKSNLRNKFKSQVRKKYGI